MFLTAALCVKYYRVQAGREKKKKKEPSLTHDATNKQGS